MSAAVNAGIAGLRYEVAWLSALVAAGRDGVERLEEFAALWDAMPGTCQ